MPDATAIQDKAYQRRWAILVVLCVSLLVIVLDNSILNVAIPTLIRDLGASNSQVQWMVDSYTLVFAGLLLTMGALGDRYGRRGALMAGYVLFGLGSLASAFAGSADQLIATRAFMGIGGALIMPATLSIITNVFPPAERGRAIGVWAGTAGVGIAIGPLAGGFLLTHFYWGSIFLVNLPIVAFGLIAGFVLIPTSKDPSAPKLDPVGALLSIVALVSIVYALIEAPTDGWTSTTTLGILGFGLVVLGVFVWWERRSDHPMLDVGFFKNRRFSAANAAITLIFFAMFGSIFLLTQYMQFTLGYSPLASGVRLLPYAITMMIVAPTSARVVERFGSKVTVATGLALAAAALFLMLGLQVDTSYPQLAWRLVILAAGMGLVMAPATDSVMGSLPLAKAGVGSAVNDTTRQVGGALGVAIVGSVVSSVYGTKIADFFAGKPAPKAAVDAAKNSLGGAYAVANDLSHRSVPGAKTIAASLLAAANSAFVDAFHSGVIVGGIVLIVAFVIVVIYLPARATEGLAAQPAAVPEDAGTAGAVAAVTADVPGAVVPVGVTATPDDLPEEALTLTATPVRGGRPRSAEADDAILDAALDQFCDFGYDGLSVERVAAGAGVAKTTIYRRYPTKLALVMAALERAKDGARAPEGSGSLRADLLEMGRSYLAMVQSPTIGRAMPMLLASKARSDELASAHAEFVRARRATGFDLIRDGIARGELDADADPSLIADMLYGAIFTRVFVTAEPTGEDYLAALVDRILAG